MLCGGRAEVHSTMAREWEAEEWHWSLQTSLHTQQTHAWTRGQATFGPPARHMNIKCYKATGTSHCMS